jgi:membrane protease YdiL (CAAX protease family)
MPATSTLASAFEIVLVLAGLAAIWQTALRPEARRRSAVVRLPKWEISPINFLFFLWAIYAGGFLAQFLVYLFLKTFTSVTDDTRLILASAAADCSMLLAWVLAKPRLDAPAGNTVSPFLPRALPWKTGALTFLTAWPAVLLVMLVWQNGLNALGIPLEKQDAVDLFAKAKDLRWLAFLTAFAVVLAPVTEELVHRGAIFRYVRERLPRPLALLAPACLFAAFHWNLASFAPLATLAVIFSLAYERTGDIRVTMIAHGLFNLNTAVLILAGLGM